MNVTARRLSDAELWKSYELVDAILKKKKEDGQKFGKIRETLASYLSVSPAQVGKMQYVERNAISEVKEAVENGEISISTANEIAKLDEDEQEELVQNTDLSSIKHKDIKKRNAASKPETEEAEKVDICSNFYPKPHIFFAHAPDFMTPIPRVMSTTYCISFVELKALTTSLFNAT